MLPPGSAARMAAAGSSASAAMPRHSRIRWNTTIRLVPRKAERRAARGSGTVFIRISTCGREAPPRARPSSSDSVSHDPENSRPGWKTAGPRASAPACNIANGSKPNRARQAGQHPDRQRHHQRRLDDLEPRDGQHAAQQRDRQHAGEHDQQRCRAAEAEQQVQDAAGPDELGGEVGQDHHQLGDGNQRTQVRGAKAGDQHVAHGVFAKPLERGCEQEQHQRPAGDDADCEHHPIRAEQRDQPGDAQQPGGGHEIPGHGEGVLPRQHLTAGNQEVGNGAGAAAGPDHDAEGEGEDEYERHQVGRVQPRVGKGCHWSGPCAPSRAM